MIKITQSIGCVGAMMLIASSANASGTYYGLGANRTASGVSADGSVVAGTTSSLAPYFLWTLSNPGVTTLIGGVSPGSGVGGNAQVSADGDKVSGTVAGFVGAPPIPATVVNQMAVYDVSDGMWTGVGGIGWYSGTEASGGWAMSSDGTTLAGLGWSPNMTNAYAVTSTNGGAPVALPWLVPGRSTRTNGCDADGSVVVGWQDNPFGFRQAAVWNNGVGQRLWRVYPNQPLSEAQACSADGTWVVGSSSSGTDGQAWRWSQGGGVELLGDLVPGWNGAATGISANGNVIVGYERPAGPATQGQGFIWTSTGGIQNLTDYVINAGVAIPGGTILALPLNVSGDGLTFVGLTNGAEGFVVRLDPPADPSVCDGDVNGDGQVNVTDMLSLISAWGACVNPGKCPADVNHDGQVNVNDLLTIISAWGLPVIR